MRTIVAVFAMFFFGSALAEELAPPPGRSVFWQERDLQFLNFQTEACHLTVRLPRPDDTDDPIPQYGLLLSISRFDAKLNGWLSSKLNNNTRVTSSGAYVAVDVPLGALCPNGWYRVRVDVPDEWLNNKSKFVRANAATRQGYEFLVAKKGKDTKITQVPTDYASLK